MASIYEMAAHDQLDLFATLGPAEAPKAPAPKKAFDAYEASPDGIALVYTATEKGNCTDPHFFLTIDDAMKLCSDERSKGVLHGTRWAYFWTSLKNYASNYWMGDDGGLDFSKFHDNGSRDGLLAELGIEKIDFHEVVALLEKAGFKVRTPVDAHKELAERLSGKRFRELEQEVMERINRGRN